MAANQVSLNMRIANAGAATILWSDIKVRYYFTYVLQNADPLLEVDYLEGFGMVKGRITASFQPGYLEIGFMTGSGSLEPLNGTSGEMKMRFRTQPFTDWNTSRGDDYSFRACGGTFPSTTTYYPHDRMTGYVRGQLVWGDEPE